MEYNRHNYRCQPSGSASSDFSEQQLGFSPSSGPSCHHPQGSGGKVVVRWDAEAPRRPSSARSLHPALLVEHHRVHCSHSSACCSISRVTVAPRRGSTSHELWLPVLGRSPGEGRGYPLQYSGLENFMACIGVAKSQTGLSEFHFHFSPSLWT